MDWDAFLTSVTEFGRYQRFVVALLCLGAFLDAYNGYGLVFLAYSPPHRCVSSTPTLRHSPPHSSHGHTLLRNASNLTFHQCSSFAETLELVSEPCTEWSYDKAYFDDTLITRWDLVCSWALASKTMLACVTAATVLGCLFYSYVSDRWGRKPAVLLSIATYTVGSSLSLAMPSLALFTAVRVLASINAISTFNLCYVWALELTGPGKRSLVTALMTGAYSLAMVSLSGIAWLSRSWLEFGLATSVPFVGLLSFGWLLAESPAWLISHGRSEEAHTVVQNMLRWEKRLPKSSRDSSAELFRSLSAEPKDQPAPPTASHNILHLFRQPELCKKSLIICWAFTANVVTFTAISYNMENLGGNLYVTWAVQSAVEAPATALNLLYVNRFGRIRPLGIAMSIAGALCLGTLAAEGLGDWAVLCLAFAAKFAICSSYALVYQVAGEIFPTVVRSLGLGLATVVGNLGNVVMPYIVHSSTAYRLLPMGIVGALALSGGLAALLLPETMGTALPQQLEDAEKSGVSLRNLVSNCAHRPKPSRGSRARVDDEDIVA